MWTIQKEIKKIVRDLQIAADQFHRLDERREHKVLQDVKRHFLTDFDASFWWESFRYESGSRPLDNPHKHLPDLCPNEGKKIWLIPCEDDESVYDTFPEIAVRIIDECPPFEYAVIDKKLEWLFLENHHNLMCASGAKAVLRLKEIKEEPTTG
jgi:hypothetical protein